MQQTESDIEEELAIQAQFEKTRAAITSRNLTHKELIDELACKICELHFTKESAIELQQLCEQLIELNQEANPQVVWTNPFTGLQITTPLKDWQHHRDILNSYREGIKDGRSINAAKGGYTKNAETNLIREWVRQQWIENTITSKLTKAAFARMICPKIFEEYREKVTIKTITDSWLRNPRSAG